VPKSWLQGKIAAANGYQADYRESKNAAFSK
jgi:hypothetical protein